MKCLVIGYGSIGKRHVSVLANLNHKVFVVTKQQINEYSTFDTVEDALKNENFDYIIIANPTYLHQATLEKLQFFTGKILIEKPLFAKYSPLSFENNQNMFVGYNLRFNNTLFQLQQFLLDEELISFSAHVGQHLAQWRPSRDYKNSYSASVSQGGGVLRDLSHELDYSLWICGDCVEVTALGGQWSELEIDSDDVYSIMMRSKRCPSIVVHMDYLSRIPRREIHVQTRKHTYYADLIQNVLMIDGATQQFESVNTYEKQHAAIIDGNIKYVCSYQEAIRIVELIDIIEIANQKRQWILL